MIISKKVIISHYDSIFEKPHLLSVTMREKLKSSNFNDRYIAIVNHIDHLESSGRIILNIRKDSLNHAFEIGTILQIRTTLQKTVPQIIQTNLITVNILKTNKSLRNYMLMLTKLE